MAEPDATPTDAELPATPSKSVAEALAGDTLPDEAVLRRADDKPPLYRFFRGGMYVSYMVVAVWLCGAIVLAAWRAVWGDAGQALAAKSAQVQPLQATPTTPQNQP